MWRGPFSGATAFQREAQLAPWEEAGRVNTSLMLLAFALLLESPIRQTELELLVWSTKASIPGPRRRKRGVESGSGRARGRYGAQHGQTEKGREWVVLGN